MQSTDYYSVMLIPVDNINEDSTTFVTIEGEQAIAKGNQKEKADERFLTVMQSILYKQDPPQPAILDSIFQAELKQRNLDLLSGVMVIDNKRDTVYYSSEGVLQLTPVLDEPLLQGLENEISLQAFTSSSAWYILRHMPNYYWYITGGWLLLVIGFSAFIPYHHKRTKKEISYYVDQLMESLKPVPVESLEEPEIVSEELPLEEPLLREESKGVVTLTSKLVFDTRTKNLFNNGSWVKMTEQQAKILAVFVEAPDYTILAEELRRKVWDVGVVVSVSAFRQSISRLNKALEDIPELEILNLKEEGYCLKIKETTEELP